jgi:hypothetical protein
MAYIHFPEACQSIDAVLSRSPSVDQEPSFPSCLGMSGAEDGGGIDASFDVCAVVSSPSLDQEIIAAWRAGLKLRGAIHRKFLSRARRTRKPAHIRSKVAVSIRKPVHVRARRSRVAHGGARKASDDGSGGGSSEGDGEPPPYPRSNRFKVLEAVR